LAHEAAAALAAWDHAPAEAIVWHVVADTTQTPLAPFHALAAIEHALDAALDEALEVDQTHVVQRLLIGLDAGPGRRADHLRRLGGGGAAENGLGVAGAPPPAARPFRALRTPFEPILEILCAGYVLTDLRDGVLALVAPLGADES